MIHAAALALVLSASAQVTLRGGEATPDGPIVAIDAGGIWLGAPTAEPAKPEAGRRGLDTAPSATPVLVIPWDRVKSVEGPSAKQAAPFLPIADQAWRARARLERGDVPAAEPAFEKLFIERYRTATGPTAAVIDEGLLRCRLHRAAHIAAIEPWLALLRATATPTAQALHPSWAQEAGLSAIIDPQTGLCPGLPPMWLAWKSVDNFTITAPGLKPGEKLAPSDLRAQDLANLYAQAAKFEVGQPSTVPELASNDAGVNLVWQIVAARIGSATQRESARKALADRLHAAPTEPSAAAPAVAVWQEAWCHAAIGRSLVREEAPDLKRLGVVELLNLPARYSHADPYLAGLALAESSATLRSLGDAAGADILAAELFREYPTHPAVDWGPMRSFVPKAEPTTRATPAPPPNTEPPAPQDPPATPTKPPQK